MLRVSQLNTPPVVVPMISMRNSIVTGGSFTQYSTNVHITKTGFDLLHEATAPGAFHNSGERFDPPKCHPNTRVAVIQKIMDWILCQDSETQDALIMWLCAAAGAGKSAIAQTIAELCYAEGRLVASFFFGQSDPNRNHAGSLFATIAYQMALVIPQAKEKVVTVIERDPLIFTRSLSTQFTSLVIQPLLDLSYTGFFIDPNSPRLIIIDGLDECLDRTVQRQILDIIRHGIREHHLPLIFLVASRPEHDISARFNLVDMNNVLTRLLLSNAYLPSDDIRLFLREKLQCLVENHPFKEFIPTSWPTDDVIEHLVRNSSGQFIYASTVVKYVSSIRHRPHHRLEVILNIRPARGNLPFADLDALYTHIFSLVDDIETVRHILGFLLLSSEAGAPVNHRINMDAIESILSLESGDIEVLFCDLGSIVAFRGKRKRGKSPRIRHASLPDFLFDRTRSGQFHISLSAERTELLGHCFRFLTNLPSDSLSAYTSSHLKHTAGCAIAFIAANLKHAVLSSSLRQDILSFSILSFYKNVTTPPPNGGGFVAHTSFDSMMGFFFGIFLESLKNLGEEFESLYTHHLGSFDEVLIQNLEVYYTDTRRSLLVALIHWWGNFYGSSTRPSGIILPLSDSYGITIVDDIDRDSLRLSTSLQDGLYGYIRLIYNFLEDPTRSRHCSLDAEKFSIAAVYLFTLLCEDCSRHNPPWHPKYQHIIRHIAHNEVDSGDDSEESEDHHFFGRDRHYDEKKYIHVVEYFIYFLNHAARSEELIEFCCGEIFNPYLYSGSSLVRDAQENFPNQTTRGRTAMKEYLRRMDSDCVSLQ